MRVPSGWSNPIYTPEDSEDVCASLYVCVLWGRGGCWLAVGLFLVNYSHLTAATVQDDGGKLAFPLGVCDSHMEKKDCLEVCACFYIHLCMSVHWGGGSGTSLVVFRPFICVESSIIIPKCCQLEALGSSHLNSMCVLKMQKEQESGGTLMKAHVLVLIPPWYSWTAESGTVLSIG